MTVPATLALLAFVASPVPPQRTDTPANARKVVDEVAACTAITEADARLACFDQAAAALASARRSGAIVVVDREKVRETNRSLFGFSAPSVDLFGGDDGPKEPPIREVESSIVAVLGGNAGALQLRLADGSTWRLAEASSFPPKKGDKIQIKRGSLGSYLATVGNGRALRVVRVQ